MLNINKIIVLTGPTSSGKTEISIKIAQIIPDLEIISADSMQIYKDMDIGTDKPGEEILNKYKHHCISLIEPSESYDVKQYTKQAQKCIYDILTRNKKPIIVGGTGLYIKTLINPIFRGPGRNQKIRDELTELAKEKGNIFLYEKLKECDLEYSKKISINDTRRIIRALEVFYLTGKPVSYFHNKEDNHKNKAKYQYYIICIYRNRENLYKRINYRVNKMVENGLIDETKELINKYNNINMNAMQGLGYKQIVDYLQGEKSQEESIEIIKKETRHFAKRQLSWFKNQIEIDYWINLDDYSDIQQCITEIVEIMKREGY
ncbi:MAG: tRNA (adenosine(37)-N6)-dimethylallyltransferase MiaA [Atribacterota bacterium]|nr:tRNA (adenosine(37)-N6)-dimethylallyltransferase MiaA [Atribacterota bacterium]MDD5636282.1 tRNA (adenosine(37)-N6)-dimethylallyltransferase MiaA [Atribacterota bacterium]